VGAGGFRGARGEPQESEAEFVLPGAIKLGLGDSIFYSIMVGRAAMYDMMTVYSCYLAIIAGLGQPWCCWRSRGAPSRPSRLSICLGVLFHLLTRVLLEPFGGYHGHIPLVLPNATLLLVGATLFCNQCVVASLL